MCFFGLHINHGNGRAGCHNHISEKHDDNEKQHQWKKHQKPSNAGVSAAANNVQNPRPENNPNEVAYKNNGGALNIATDIADAILRALTGILIQHHQQSDNGKNGINQRRSTKTCHCVIQF